MPIAAAASSWLVDDTMVGFRAATQGVERYGRNMILHLLHVVLLGAHCAGISF